MTSSSRKAWPAIALVFAAILISLLSSFGVAIGLYYAAAIPALIGGAVIYYVFLTAQPSRTEKIFHITALATLILCATWPRYAAFFLPGLPLINPQRIANVVLLATLMLALFSSDYISGLIRNSLMQHRAFWAAFFVYILARIASVFFSSEPFTSGYRLTQELFVHVIFVAVGLHFGVTEKNRRILAFALVACTVIATAAAWAEFSLGRNIFSYFITPQNDYMAWALSDQFRDGRFRAKGTFDHPLTMAEFISISAAIGSALLFASKSALSKYILLPLFLASAVSAALLSGSRSGYGAMALVIALLVVLPPVVSTVRGYMTLGRAAFWSIASIFLGAMLVVGLVTVFEYTLGKHAYSDSDAMRAQMFERTIGLLKESPLWGHGVGLAPEKIGVLTERTRVYTVDSFFMSIAVESGLPALLSLLFMLVYTALEGIRKSVHPGEQDWALWIGFAVAILVCLMFKSILSLLDNNHLLFLLLGVLTAAPTSKGVRHG